MRDHTDRVLTDAPISGHPVILHVAVPRFARRTSDCSAPIGTE
ncbi:hypothetical protein MUG78_05200 [Gordonia alkaliphila]|nr:hypothetical protein [Gordonia alkaliphila]MCK0438877.1 hypothetical protein [Gordonia alkaliphila]